MNQDNSVILVLFGSLVYFVIIYMLIRGAVSSANKEMSQHIQFLARLKMREMKKNGHTFEEIQEDIDQVYKK
jgi:hypothetical protein